MSLIKLAILSTVFLCYQHGECDDSALGMPDIDGIVRGDHLYHVDAGGGVVVPEVMAWEYRVPGEGVLSSAAVLAIIRIESVGDPYARRQGSPYWGLLQISGAYLSDAVEYHHAVSRQGANNTPEEWRLPEVAEDLDGRGDLSLWVFYWYMRRYQGIHQWDPLKIALLHKAGPNAGGRIIKMHREMGIPLGEAACKDDSPGTCEYLKRFHAYFGVYQKYMDSRLVFHQGDSSIIYF